MTDRHNMVALAEQLNTELHCLKLIERDQRIMTKCQEMGYGRLRFIQGQGVCGLFRFMYTVGVCYGLDETGYKGRYCFDTAQNAGLFLEEWDGVTPPVIGEDGCTAIK